MGDSTDIVYRNRSESLWPVHFNSLLAQAALKNSRDTRKTSEKTVCETGAGGYGAGRVHDYSKQQANKANGNYKSYDIIKMISLKRRWQRKSEIGNAAQGNSISDDETKEFLSP